MFLLTAAAGSGINADTGTITTLHLILIAILIVLVIAAIIWGARQKRARVSAQHDEAARNDALLAHPQTETAVSPAPPPLGDAGVTVATAEALTPVVAPVAKRAAKRTARPAAAKPVAVAAPTPVAKPAAARPVAAKPEPAAAAPKPARKPAAAKPVAEPTASDYGLIDVKGLGPKAVPLLQAQGVTTLADLAGLNAARAAEIDAGLGVLSGRLTRDQWVAQAKLLAAGKVAEFEAAYGKL